MQIRVPVNYQEKKQSELNLSEIVAEINRFGFLQLFINLYSHKTNAMKVWESTEIECHKFVGK